MISYIVASNHYPTLRDYLAATLKGIDDDEIVLVEDPPSLAAAYNEGQRRARNPIRCYVHHDVRVLDPPRLRAELIRHCSSDVGMVGVIGSRSAVWPWWDGDALGSVWDTRLGALDFGPGGDCSILDGLLLATAQTVEWDETYPGFHGYDHDICRQQLALGRPNRCLTGGRSLLAHHTGGPVDVKRLNGWDDAARRYREKWGSDGVG